MRRLLVVVVGILAAWLGVAEPVMAAAVVPTHLEVVHVYAHSDHHDTEVPTQATTERGPPASYYAGTTYDAVDRRSHGAATRPATRTALQVITYDDPALLAQSVGVVTTTLEAAPDSSGLLLSFQRSDAAANAGDDVVRALSATERRTLDHALRPDKLDHIFDPKHNFQPLVQQFGSREAVMEQIVRSIGGPLPQAGRFEIAQSIGGQTVIIRGAVVGGIPRIGTAFTQ